METSKIPTTVQKSGGTKSPWYEQYEKSNDGMKNPWYEPSMVRNIHQWYETSKVRKVRHSVFDLQWLSLSVMIYQQFTMFVLSYRIVSYHTPI